MLHYTGFLVKGYSPHFNEFVNKLQYSLAPRHLEIKLFPCQLLTFEPLKFDTSFTYLDLYSEPQGHKDAKTSGFIFSQTGTF